MSDEEKKAIEDLENLVEINTSKILEYQSTGMYYNKDVEKNTNDIAILLKLFKKQHNKIDKIEKYIQQEIWLCEHDIDACCDDEQEIKEYYIDRKKMFEEVQNKLLEE